LPPRSDRSFGARPGRSAPAGSSHQLA
jgi:hypothetical protein